jgi:heavy metal sensor kinase
VLNVLVILGLTAVVYARSNRLAHEALRRNLRLRAKTLAGVFEIDRGKLDLEASPKAMPEYHSQDSGVFAEFHGPKGETMKSPSLGKEQTLPPDGPWVEDAFVFSELEDGPHGVPCATVTYSFLARIEKVSKKKYPDYVPPTEEDRRFQVRVAMDSRPRDEDLAGLALFLALAGGVALVVTIMGALLVARTVLRPIRRMTDEAAELTPEDTTRRLGPDMVVKELHSLSTTLNSAFDRLADALDRERRFTSDASHELRTPISVLMANAELLLRRPRESEEYREGLRRQQKIAERMRHITENLLTLARMDASSDGLEREELSPGDVLSPMCEEFRTLAGEKGIRIDCEIQDGVRVHGDPQHLGQLAQNLISNALKYTPAGGRVSVRVGAVNGEAVLSVSDSGPGIPAEHRARIFDRFYRIQEGKDRREGAGLGLAIVNWVVRAHGGSISVDSSPEGGAVFKVGLPLSNG